ncbi:MAG TPA: DUF4492 domain-containing protein [Bacteroidales bacterium]|nr:DUF4492 domain-containing protein [Bacteroidales bacterium]
MIFLSKIYRFYIDSFLHVGKYGKRLIMIVLIKLFIMFAILKVFFFKDFLGSKFSTDKQKSEYVINSLTKQ